MFDTDTIIPDRAPGAASRAAAKPVQETKTINLALQGGGAHGAFTWGVLDRLLEEPRLEIEGISATSAGAMNAAVFAHGMAEGARPGARSALTDFWRRIAQAGASSPLQPTLLDRVMGNRALEWSPAYIYFDLVSRLLSPYQFNPLNHNPLREVLLQSVDFERLRSACCPVRLFLSATNVRTGKVRVFENDTLSPEAVLASGCLPFLFQAVEVEGEHYWDGGYMGNPAIYPLIYSCRSADILVVHINPLLRDKLPTTAGEILNRINEISFNSSLMREMRAVAFVTKMIDDGMVCSNQLKRMFIHAVAADEVMSELGVASKLNADWDFLCYLRDIGRARADAWLAASFDRLGRESTIDIRERYL